MLVSVLHNNYKFFQGDNSYAAQVFYTQHKDTLHQVFIKKDSLMNAYTPDFDAYKANHFRTIHLFNDEGSYEIEKIDKLFTPDIQSGASSLNDGYIDISIKNQGWTAKLVEIKNIEGTINWLNKLPQTVENCDIDCPSLQGNNYETNKKYKVKLIFEDMLDQKHTFIMEGKNLGPYIYKE